MHDLMRWQSLFAALTAILLGGCASARQLDVVPRPGATVRFQTTEHGARWVRGQLVSLDTESLRVAAQGRVDTVVALRQVRRLDISVGRRNNAGRGALIGAGIGVATGLIVGLGLASECTSCSIGIDQTVTIPVFGFVGTGVGTLIGALSQSERWAEVRRPWAITPR